METQRPRKLVQKLSLPSTSTILDQPCRSNFPYQTWLKAQVLLVGAILAPRKRTVAIALRAVRLADRRGFAKYHRVPNRAVWSSHQASQLFLTLLLSVLDDGHGPLVFGIDETIERRWGFIDNGPRHLPRCSAVQR